MIGHQAVSVHRGAGGRSKPAEKGDAGRAELEVLEYRRPGPSSDGDGEHDPLSGVDRDGQSDGLPALWFHDFMGRDSTNAPREHALP